MLAAAIPARAFQVQGIFQFGPAHVGIAFTDSVNAAQATEPSHYTLTPTGGAPAVSIQSVALQENQRTVILTITATLPASSTYNVAVSGVTSRQGAALDPGGPTSFTTVAGTVLGIAQVHEQIGTLDGQTITVIGQVYIRPTTTTPASGFIQDGTGRGLNIFGSTVPAGADVIGNVLKVTGTADLYFTTVEVTTYSATVLATGMPHLAPRVLTVAQAASSQWEGTYIRTTATLTGPPVASGSYNYNYDAQDGGVDFDFRVRNATGISPTGFTTGDVVTGAGAGSKYQTTYQIQVGNAADFFEGTGTGDITPPALVSAAGAGGGTSVTVQFSEPVAAGASTAGNYSV